MSTDFSGIERRVRDECRDVGNLKARLLVREIAVKLGYNPDTTWGMPDEFIAAVKTLKGFAGQRFAETEFNQVWAEAEKAALDVLKKEVKS